MVPSAPKRSHRFRKIERQDMSEENGCPLNRLLNPYFQARILRSPFFAPRQITKPKTVPIMKTPRHNSLFHSAATALLALSSGFTHAADYPTTVQSFNPVAY